MNILKAYTDAGFHNHYVAAGKNEKFENNAFKEIIKNSGDSVRLSDQAMELLDKQKYGASLCPQDATYDQYGNVNRQLEALQWDLKNLTLAAWPINASLASQVSQMKSQVQRLQMQI